MKTIDFEQVRTDLMPQAMRLTKNRTDAEDLMQDTLVKAVRFIDQYDPKRSLNNWVQKIMIRTWLDTVRERNRRIKAVSTDNPLQGEHEEPLYLDFASGTDIEKEVIDSMTGNELSEFLLSTFKKNAIPLIMSEVDDLDYEEIALALDTKVGTVRSRIHRCRKQAKAVIGSNPALMERFGVAA